MERAAVLVGVRKTGGLRELKAATQGARAMASWARSQGVQHVELLTDEAGPVEVRQIQQVIRQIVDLGTVEQLLLYFAGHGVNIGYGERWLLSGAPDYTQEAVNVKGSEELARWCGIPHVIFISDACRTAAEGIRAQSVTGSEVFPNIGASEVEQAVDLFFACTLGRPALEVRDPDAAASAFKAVYTEVLLDDLGGRNERLLERVEEGGKVFGVVRPRPLKLDLQAEVGRRLAAANVQPGISQMPDARITSDGAAWLSRVALQTVQQPAPPDPRMGAVRRDRALTAPGPRRRGVDFSVTETPQERWHSLFREVLGGGRPLPRVGGLERSLDEAAIPFGPMHFETDCGFKVRGAQLAEAFSRSAHTELLGAEGEILRIDQVAGPAANVLLTFRNGTGTVLPAIPDFISALSFEDGELVNVSYEPSDRSWRWSSYQDRHGELALLRTVIASSARLGVFRLEGDDALALARRMQLLKGSDPTMALYAGYAYHDLGQRGRIAEMQFYMKGELHLRLFDIALLSRSLYGRTIGTLPDVFPFVPMLSQGWALLAAHKIAFPPSLAGLERHLVPSLWTLFDPQGVAMLRAALDSQEVR
jgi:hypothetical protein